MGATFTPQIKKTADKKREDLKISKENLQILTHFAKFMYENRTILNASDLRAQVQLANIPFDETQRFFDNFIAEKLDEGTLKDITWEMDNAPQFQKI